MFSFLLLSLLLTFGAPKASAKDGSASSKPLQCGVSSQPLPDKTDDKWDITRGQFPWLAAIYRLDNGTWTYTCSGTLISTRTVVTAAHCILTPEEGKDKPENIKVGLGKLNYYFESKETDSIIADVREVTIHNQFKEPVANYAFDVALLDLAVSVTPTPHINPACLPVKETSEINLDGKGYIAGWTDNKNESQSLKVSFYSPVICLQKLPNPVYKRYVTPDKICAERVSGMEADRGSGGAGLTVDIQGANYAIGVLSTKIPSVYLLTDMRNADIVNWIKSEQSRLDALH